MTRTAGEWAAQAGISARLLVDRLAAGWPEHEVLMPKRRRGEARPSLRGPREAPAAVLTRIAFDKIADFGADYSPERIYRVGDRIAHDGLGRGEVIALPAPRRIVVRFDDGTKHVLVGGHR